MTPQPGSRVPSCEFAFCVACVTCERATSKDQSACASVSPSVSPSASPSVSPCVSPAEAKANWRKILLSVLRPASRSPLCPRLRFPIEFAIVISMLISIVVVNASSPPPISLSHAVWFYR